MQTVQQPLPPLQALHKSLPLAQTARCPLPLPQIPTPGLWDSRPDTLAAAHTRSLHARTRGLHAHTRGLPTRTGKQLPQLQVSSSGSTRAMCSPEARHCYAAHTLMFGAVTLHALVRLPPPGLQSGRPPPAKRCSTKCNCKAVMDPACTVCRVGSLDKYEPSYTQARRCNTVQHAHAQLKYSTVSL